MSLLRKLEIYDRNTVSSVFVNSGGQALAADGLTRISGTLWQASTIDANYWTLANNGAGSAASLASSVVTLTSGTANNGYGSIISVRRARFLFVNPNRWRGFLRIPSLTAANNTRYFGAMTVTAGSPPTIDAGFYFSVASGGAVSVNTKVTGSAASSVSSSFNGELGSTYTIDTNYHDFDIVYFIAKAWFFVDGTLLHSVTPTTGLLSDVMALYNSALSLNSAGGTASGSIELGAMSILRHGKESSRPRYSNISTNGTTVLKSSVGTLQRIVINKAGAGNTITIYDQTSAASPAIGTISPANSQVLEYGFDLQNGLTVVLSGGTASNITVIYD